MTSLLENSLFIWTKAIFSFISLRNSAAFSGSCPRASLRQLIAVFIKFVMLTPGSSTGYWKLRKTPARERSSGLIASRSSPWKLMLPAVTSNCGFPASTALSVLLPAPFGPITA